MGRVWEGDPGRVVTLLSGPLQTRALRGLGVTGLWDCRCAHLWRFVTSVRRDGGEAETSVRTRPSLTSVHRNVPPGLRSETEPPTRPSWCIRHGSKPNQDGLVTGVRPVKVGDPGGLGVDRLDPKERAQTEGQE